VAVDEVARMPRGFRAAAMAAGIKASGRRDIGLLVTTDGPASVAAAFTANTLAAAPVRLSRAHLAASGGWTSAILATSGCANAATGQDGERDQAELAALVADALGVDARRTLALSTGMIGTRLPMARLRGSIPALAGELAPTDAALADLADQICTTDGRPKVASARLDLGGGVTVSGIAKGVGMIHPRMATMLAVLLTDARVEPPALQAILRRAVERTWNQLTIDGDTSTNDTVFLLASGAAAGTEAGADVRAGSAAYERLAEAVEAVARSLARQQAADGEGATTLITCQVSGARDDHAARAVARAIVASSLVKAAVHGRDPNWGRIAAAIGNARLHDEPVAVDEPRLRIAIGGVPVFDGGPVPVGRQAVATLMAAPEVVIRVELDRGGGSDGRGEAFGCDLSPEYVIENSVYSS
jgi:glutamate N-acetyltransferase/amino-acid N-acetyltransferase